MRLTREDRAFLKAESDEEKAQRIAYAVTLEPEDVPVRGNAMASGDEAVDAAAESWVLAQLEAGNIAAWCCAKVTATLTIDGETFVGTAHMGCCSYKTEEECERSMLEEYRLQDEARADLIATLESAVRRGDLAAKALVPTLKGAKS